MFCYSGEKTSPNWPNRRVGVGVAVEVVETERGALNMYIATRRRSWSYDLRQRENPIVIINYYIIIVIINISNTTVRFEKLDV